MFNLKDLDNKITNNEDFTDYILLPNELAISYIKYKLNKSDNNNNSENNENIRRYDYMYKKLVKLNASSKCQITGYINTVCDVAHIYPFSKCKLNSEKYDPANGIFICSNIHKLLDNTKYINIVYDDDNNYFIKIEADMCKPEELNCARHVLNISNDSNMAPINNMSADSKKYIDMCKIDS